MLIAAIFALVGFTTAVEVGVRLNQTCQVQSDCYNDWAYCNEMKVCACYDDYLEVDGLCKPKDLYCPNFVGMDKLPALKLPCESGYTLDNAGNVVPDDTDHNCTKSEFCFIHSTSRTESGYLFGHCCPKSLDAKYEPACPTTPKSSLFCGSRTDPDTCSLDKKDICNETIIDKSLVKTCCPDSCPDEHGMLQINIEGTGRCFVLKQHDEVCEYTAQCELGRCVAKNGIGTMEKRCVMDKPDETGPEI